MINRFKRLFRARHDKQTEHSKPNESAKPAAESAAPARVHTPPVAPAPASHETARRPHPASHPPHEKHATPAKPDKPSAPPSHPQAPRSHETPRAPHPPPQGVFTLILPPLQRAVAEEGYTLPTPIQEQTIPHLLEGKDLIGCAQTGTGKTAAFTLPILQYLAQNPVRTDRGRPRVLILAPTRELAAQIGDSIRAYGRHLRVRHTVIFGGVSQHPQVKSMERGVDIVVATPGRLLDLKQQGYMHLDGVEIFVLDEADRMLDMGFLPDIRRIISALPHQRQSLFFSATMAPDVVALARTMVHNAVHVTIAPEQPTIDKIAQKVMFVEKHDKPALLISLLREGGLDKVIVFTRMKHGANRVAERLSAAGIVANAIHSDKTQGARMEALAGFKTGKVRVLVATEIAARGIDVEGITHVINYDLPDEAQMYVHRIGRTARAGADGDAISFCSPEERDALRDIERLLKQPIPVETNQPFHSERSQELAKALSRLGPKSVVGSWGPGGRRGRRRGPTHPRR